MNIRSARLGGIGAAALVVALLPLVPTMARATSADTATPQTTSFDQPLPDAADEIAAHTMAEHFSLPLGDARYQMSHQSALMDLSANVAAASPTTWGGSRIDHANGGTLTIWTTDQARTSALVAAAHPTAPVLVRPVERSWQDLKAEATQLQSELDRAGVVQAVVSVDVAANGVRLHLPSTSAVSAVADAASNENAAAAIAARHASVAVESSGGIGRPFACRTNWEICDPPLRAGVEVRNHTNGEACTAGFVVRSKTDHKPYMLTAAHCVHSSGTSAVWYSANAYGTRMDIGSTHNDIYGDCVTIGGRCYREPDAAIVNVGMPTQWGLPVSTRVLVSQSAGSRPTTRDENYAITSVGYSCASSSTCQNGLPADSYLCWTGATNYTHCGRFAGVAATGLGSITVDNYGACEGDSGGPVYASHRGFGLINGGPVDLRIADYRFLDQPTSAQAGCTGAGHTFYYSSLAVSLNGLNVELIP